MNGLSEIPIVRDCGWALVHSLWQGAVLAALLAAALRLCRHRSAALRYALACTALAALLAAPIATTILLPLGTTTPAPAVATAAATTPAVTAFRASPVEGAQQQTSALAPVPAPVPWTARAVAALDPLLPAATALWLGGVGVLSLLRLAGYRRVRAIRRSAVTVDEPSLTGAMEALARQMALSRPVGLLRSARVAAPATIGWLRPMILLPVTAWTGLDELQLRAILAHELAHIRRYDYLVNLLQTIVESLLFYHPAAWWISARIRREREHCCDDVAASVCGDRFRYAKALLVLESQRQRSVAPAVASDGGSLVGRVRRLLAVPDPRRGVPASWLGGVVAAAVTLGLIAVVGFADMGGAARPMQPQAAPELAPATGPSDEMVTRAYNVVEILQSGIAPSFSPHEPTAEKLARLARTIRRHLPTGTDTDVTFAGNGDPWRVRTSPTHHAAIEAILRSLREHRGSILIETRFIELDTAADRKLRRSLEARGRPVMPPPVGTAAWTLPNDALDGLTAEVRKIEVTPRLVALNGQNVWMKVGKEVPFKFGSGEGAVVTYGFAGHVVTVNALLRADGERLSLYAEPEMSEFASYGPTPTVDVATAAVRLDLPPDRRTAVVRMPVRRYALKFVGPPTPDQTPGWDRHRDHFARELIDPDATPERWVYVFVTTTVEAEADGG